MGCSGPDGPTSTRRNQAGRDRELSCSPYPVRVEPDEGERSIIFRNFGRGPALRCYHVSFGPKDTHRWWFKAGTGRHRAVTPTPRGDAALRHEQREIDPQRQTIFVLMVQRKDFGNSDAADIRGTFQQLAAVEDHLIKAGHVGGGREQAPRRSVLRRSRPR